MAKLSCYSLLQYAEKRLQNFLFMFFIMIGSWFITKTTISRITDKEIRTSWISCKVICSIWCTKIVKNFPPTKRVWHLLQLFFKNYVLIKTNQIVLKHLTLPSKLFSLSFDKVVKCVNVQLEDKRIKIIKSFFFSVFTIKLQISFSILRKIEIFHLKKLLRTDTNCSFLFLTKNTMLVCITIQYPGLFSPIDLLNSEPLVEFFLKNDILFHVIESKFSSASFVQKPFLIQFFKNDLHVVSFTCMFRTFLMLSDN